MFGQHVGHQRFVPSSHLINLLFLLVDLDFPQEQGSGKFLHLQTTEGGFKGQDVVKTEAQQVLMFGPSIPDRTDTVNPPLLLPDEAWTIPWGQTRQVAK